MAVLSPEQEEVVPEDQKGTESLTAGEQASLDQMEAGLREGESAPEPDYNQKIQGEVSGSKKSLQKKLLIGGGVGGGAIGIGAIILLLLLFKNIHIKNLFMDYEFAKFNRAFRNRLEQSVDEADPEGPGTADSTVQPSDSPATTLDEIDSSQIKTLQNEIKTDPQAFDDAVGDAESLNRTAAVPGTMASEVDPELGINDTVASTDGESDAQATEDTDTAIQDQIDQATGSESAPNAAVQDAIDDTTKALDAGASSSAAAQSAGEGFSRGLNGIMSDATGPFLFATIGCIARDIYETGYKAATQLKLTGLANSAATTNKYADCQKQGKCYLTQIGTVADQFDGTVDGKAQSFTSSCGGVRASQQVANPGVNCTDLDTNMRPVPAAGLASGFTGTLGTALAIGDKVNTVLTAIPGLGAGCDIVLKPGVQAAFAVAGVGAAIIGVVTDTVDFGASTVAQASLVGGAVVFGSTAGKALALDAALHYGNLLFKQNFSPIQKGNMQDAGDKAIATDYCARSGCQQLSNDQNTQLSLAIHGDLVKQQQHSSLAYRLFSPSNPTSTAGILVDRMPTSPSAAMASIGQFVATTLNPAKLGKSLLGMINPTTPAWAADTEYQTYGIPDYGFTDVELNMWGVKENSAWITNNLTADQKTRFDKCFNPSSTKLGDLLSNNGTDAEACNALTQQSEVAFNQAGGIKLASATTAPAATGDGIAFAHYRIYILDTEVTHDLALLYNNQDGIGGTNSAAPTSTAGCVNPLADPSWGLSRTDQGVDYNPPNGHPLPVYAICDGTILTTTSPPGWPGGYYLTYKLSSGPFVGKCIYVAEHLSNVLPIGTQVKAGQQIATALPGSPWTEWGWSQGWGTPATPYPKGTPESNHYATDGGKAFARFMKSLGAPVRDDPGPGPMYAGASCS